VNQIIFLWSAVVSSPDGSGKPLQKNTVFCRSKKATAGSSFYFVQNRVFFKKLVTQSWIGYSYYLIGIKQ
jgi:hypothetical protein